MTKRLLLTGAGGFVGHHTLGHVLQQTDWEVVCTDSFRHMGKTDRLREVLEEAPEHQARVTVLTHDLRAPVSPQLADAFGEIDYVIAMASESHVDRSISDPRPFVENNVQVALTMLEYAREYAVEKFVHVSTDEVYGPARDGHDHLEGSAHRPSNPYAASKAAQEAIVNAYWRTYGMPCAVATSMNMIGERQDPEKFVPLIISRCAAGLRVPIHVSADGSEDGSRFYLHARNYANALIWLLERVPFPVYDGENEMERFNVVGEELGNQEMAQLVADCAGTELLAEPVDFHTYRPGHDLRYALDGAKMAALGWVPPLGLAESLRNTVEWTLQHPEWMLTGTAHTSSPVHPAAA